MIKISVCMATYNGEKYIAQQLHSILYQLHHQDELIISDDGSSDSTLEIITDFNDYRIKIIRTTPCRNPIFNFEKAISAATGDVIVLSDQDDVWLNDRLNIVRKLFDGRQDEFLTVCLDSSVTNRELQITFPSLLSHINAGPGLVKNIIRNGYVGCHMAFTRKISQVSIPFPKNIPMHDVWIGLISEIYGHVMFIKDKPTMLFRRHDNNATKSGISLGKKLKWRLSLIINIMKVILRKKGLKI